MKTIIELIKGKVYSQAGFLDSDLTIPSISTYVYEGYDDVHGHLFLDAEAHLEKTQVASEKKGHYLSYPEGSIHTILDKKHLIEWLNEEHSPTITGKDYEYKAV